jgi:hypothetical protein
VIKVRAAQPGLSKELITNADGLDEDAKLDAVVDIETLNTQLAKHDPDPSVVDRLWSRRPRVVLDVPWNHTPGS